MTVTRYVAILALSCAAAFTQGGFTGPGQYKIANAENGKVLDISGGGLIQMSNGNSPDQVWDISDAGGGYYYIRSMANGNALEETTNRNSSPVMANPYKGSVIQRWKIESNSNGHAIIVSNSGKALDVPDGTKRDGARIQVYDRNGEGNQQFTFTPQSGSRDNPQTNSGGWNNNSGWSNARNTQPDQSGRYWDERDRMFKLTGDGVCFYREPNYGGSAFCLQSGASNASINTGNAGQFASVKLFGHSKGVEVYSGANFQGDNFRITRDEPDLHNNRRWADARSGVGSMRVD
jgi:hypothetical protein